MIAFVFISCKWKEKSVKEINKLLHYDDSTLLTIVVVAESIDSYEIVLKAILCRAAFSIK